MSILIVNTLPEDAAREAVALLAARSSDCRVIHTRGMHLQPCVGCNACWLRTPGICALRDGYEEILRACLRYDAVIFLAGTALNFVDHHMKNVVDRLLPLVTMYTRIVDGQCRHVPRYNKTYRFGLLYAGAADRTYLNEWLGRVALNMAGVSLGARPIEEAEEAFACIC